MTTPVSRAPDLVGHMLEAAPVAREYVEGMNEAGFMADRRAQQAVILNLVILGEAATRLSNDHPAIVARFPAVPWRSVRSMRNRLTHGYFDIDLSTVWRTVIAALPALIDELQALELGLKSWPRRSRCCARP